jgi:hypothetical protein
MGRTHRLLISVRGKPECRSSAVGIGCSSTAHHSTADEVVHSPSKGCVGDATFFAVLRTSLGLAESLSLSVDSPWTVTCDRWWIGLPVNQTIARDQSNDCQMFGENSVPLRPT